MVAKIVAALFLALCSGIGWAQTGQAPSKTVTATGSADAAAQTQAERAEQVRNACIEGRRFICGRVLQVTPAGLVVDSGYKQLLSPPFDSSWVTSGTASLVRSPNAVEEKRPDAVSVGLVFLSNIPKRPRVKEYDYVVLHGYPAGEYLYVPVPGVVKTIRRFSASLERAVEWNLNPPQSKTGVSEPMPERATLAAMLGPNLLPDSSFESLDPRVFNVAAPFRVTPDPQAHSGTADVQATLSRSGKRIYSHLSTWTNTDYVSSLWLRGTGGGTLFVATDDLAKRLAAVQSTATTQWCQIPLAWNSGSHTRVAVGFEDDVSTEGALWLDDFYTGLKDGRTIAFIAPPAYAPQPQAPPGFTLVFDDEFNDRSSIDVNNTQNDGYKWYVKGMWFPSTSPAMYDILPSYKDADGVLEIKDAPVAMSWNFSTTLFDDSAPEGYRGTVFLPGPAIYFEARMACADLAHINKNGWAGFWSGTMPVSSRPRNGNPPPWSMSVENMPMPGWPGKWETIENDIMEYNPSWGHPHQWDSTIHDWSSGAESGNIGNFNSVVYAPAGTDYTQWHTYGQLWVSASPANGWHGYRQAYFDGVPQQAICWLGNQISATSQPAGNYLFSMCDGTPKSPPLWRNLMLGGAMGGTPNTFFDYVRVYALDPKASVKVVRK